MTFAYLRCMSSNSVTMPSKLLPISTEHGEMGYLCCMSSNSVTMPSKLLPISTEHGEIGIQVIGQYEGASRNSVV